MFNLKIQFLGQLFATLPGKVFFLFASGNGVGSSCQKKNRQGLFEARISSGGTSESEWQNDNGCLWNSMSGHSNILVVLSR